MPGPTSLGIYIYVLDCGRKTNRIIRRSSYNTVAFKYSHKLVLLNLDYETFWEIICECIAVVSDCYILHVNSQYISFTKFEEESAL